MIFFIYFTEKHVDTVEKALQGVERIFICHGDTDLDNFFGWTKTVIEAAKKTPSVKAIGKV